MQNVGAVRGSSVRQGLSWKGHAFVQLGDLPVNVFEGAEDLIRKVLALLFL